VANSVFHSTTTNKVVSGRTSSEVNLFSRILLGTSLAEPKEKSKKMSPTDPVEEEEKAKAEVEAELRYEKEEENHGKASPKDISDITYYHVMLLSLMIFLIRWVTQVFQPSLVWLAPRSLIKLSNHGAIVSVMPKVIYDQLNHDSLVLTSQHLQLVDESIWLLVGTAEDILVRIGNSFVPVDFMVFKNGLPRMSGIWWHTSILSTTGATIYVTARTIKLNISRKEETFTFKFNGTKKCNQVMVTIRPEGNAMTPDKKPSAAKNFSMNFFGWVKNATSVVKISLVALVN
jgi:hypothetical protein